MRELLLLLVWGVVLACAVLPRTSDSHRSDANPLAPTFTFGGDDWLNASDQGVIQRVSNAEIIDGALQLTGLNATSSQVTFR